MNTYRLYPILVLALLAGASVWLERVTRIDDPVGSQTEQTGPDFIAEHTHDEDFTYPPEARAKIAELREEGADEPD